jgi:arsenical pump membrane protein
VRALLPAGASLPDLLAIAVVSAILANLVNNLPATLILVPVAAAAGAAPVLAVLIGVNVGPNLTYVGSLATLLWRRVLHAEDTDVALGEFVRLGALTVPLGIAGACVVLWFAAQVLI